MSVRSGKVHPVLLRINRSIMKAAEKAIERCEDLGVFIGVFHSFFSCQDWATLSDM